MRSIALLALMGSWGSACAAPSAQKVKVALAPFANSSDIRFPNVHKEAVREVTVRLCREYLERALGDAGYDVADSERTLSASTALKLDFEKDKDRNLASILRLGAEMGAGLVVLVQVISVSQQNSETSAILSNLAGPKSVSKAKVRVWLADVGQKKLLIDGAKTTFEGEALGPFFGTTKRSEMSGNPQDVAYMIMEENRRRATMLGRAASEAVYRALSGLLGIKLRPNERGAPRT
jgi:hypothetical protein